jgi:two-component system CheB/CheR fusion protein
MKNTRKIVASLAGVVLLIAAAVVVVSFWAFSQMEKAAEARKHTYVVISRAGDLLSALRDAETGQRGYSLTGNEAFLGPYLAVRDSVRGQLEELRQLTLISAAHKHLDALAPLLDAKLAEMSHVIELRRNHDMTAVLAAVGSGQGKRLMDSIRAETRSFIQIEESALAQHEAEFQSNMRHLFIIIVTTSLLTLLFALSFAYFIYRETQQRLKNLAKISEDEALEYAESIIDTVREPLIALDQDLRVVSVSRSFYEFFKVKPEETVGQLIYDLGNKQWDIPKLRELLETILPQKTTFDNYEVEHDFATIGTRIMLLNARQIQRVLGKERIILLAIEDITERREIENGLEKAHEELKELAAELKRVARVKAEFLANMSHELRTPLNSINGFSEVLYDETFGPLNEKQKKYVNNVSTSGKHLLLLINQILDMAKVEAGKMNLVLSSLPMKRLLNDISMLVADMVSKKKIEMSLKIAENLPNIEADELKVKEIIYNLLSNAVKFTPEGGKIGMRASARKADSEIEVVVWDTGVGIAPENMEKIFEGFFRVDTPYSRVTEGTGLGLPLSKKLVELHGGKLFVESEGLNKGTEVRFTLPIIFRGVV